MPDYKLNDESLALLRSPSQRYQIRCVFLPTYTPTVTQWTRPGGSGRETFEWTPETNLASSRLGVVDEPVYYYVNNAQTRTGSAIPSSDKSIDWGDGTTVSPADGLLSHSYAAGGTYEVQFTCVADGETFTSHRWVKVLASWDDDPFYGVSDLGSITGSLSSGGWQALVTLRDVTGDYLTGMIQDRQGVILYLDETWGVNDILALGTTKTLGWDGNDDAYDPRILFFGYVIGDTVRVDAESHEVTFTAQTAEALLAKMTIQSQIYLDSTKHGYGHVRDGLTFADVANHLVHRHTNWGTWHQFSVWRSGNPTPQVTINDGSIWQGLQACASNEFGRLEGAQESRLNIVPDVNARGIDWWGLMFDPPAMPFDSQNIWQITVVESPPDRTGYVEIRGSDPLGGASLTGKYPSTPGDIGGRDIKDVICHDQTKLDSWAKNIYFSDNARYAVTITTGLTRPLSIGDLVIVDHADPQGRYDFTASVGGGAYRRPFYVDGVSYTPNLLAETWQTSVTLTDIPRLRWETGADQWQTFDGSTWTAVGGS